MQSNLKVASKPIICEEIEAELMAVTVFFLNFRCDLVAVNQIASPSAVSDFHVELWVLLVAYNA